MKRIFLSALALLLCLSVLGANPLDPKGGAKITKNEAEHIALKHYPGARVTAAKLETVRGRLVWSLEIAEMKSKETTAVAVDARSGRIVSGQKGDR